MRNKNASKIGGPTDTRVVYVGSERFKLLSDTAINISYQGKRQITASQVVQYLIDNFSEEAKNKLIKEMQKS